jgi:hypothetical protein
MILTRGGTNNQKVTLSLRTVRNKEKETARSPKRTAIRKYWFSFGTAFLVTFFVTLAIAVIMTHGEIGCQAAEDLFSGKNDGVG